MRSQCKKVLIYISKLILPVQHATHEPREWQRGNVQTCSATTHQNTLTASTENRVTDQDNFQVSDYVHARTHKLGHV